MFTSYAVIKISSLGFGFILLGLIITGVIISRQEYGLLICNIPLLLVDGGALVSSWRMMKEERESAVEEGYPEDGGPMTCPECGEEKLEVDPNGTGFCKSCDYITKDYFEEVEEGEG